MIQMFIVYFILFHLRISTKTIIYYFHRVRFLLEETYPGTFSPGENVPYKLGTFSPGYVFSSIRIYFQNTIT